MDTKDRDIQELQAENERLRAALRYYAEPENWTDYATEEMEPEEWDAWTAEVNLPSKSLLDVDIDGWEIAAKALAAPDDEVEK